LSANGGANPWRHSHEGQSGQGGRAYAQTKSRRKLLHRKNPHEKTEKKGKAVRKNGTRVGKKTTRGRKAMREDRLVVH